jgi:S-disulfanyl-L-cysteine oxidoreductase SoxD
VGIASFEMCRVDRETIEQRAYAILLLGGFHEPSPNDQHRDIGGASMITFSRLASARVSLTVAATALAAFSASTAFADDGWFQQVQATAGRQTFNNYCAQCHGPELTGAAGPALIGPTFLSQWSNKPLSDLYAYEHQNMPATNPGSVPADQLWKITAYILQKNGFPSGDTDVTVNASRPLQAKPAPAK